MANTASAKTGGERVNEPTQTTAPAIELDGLTKTFRHATAVDGLNLTVPQGSVFGFLGPNGAGKTTTLRILASLARPTSGDAFVLGHRVPADATTRSFIGYLPDVPGFPTWMTAGQYLRFVGELFGLRGSQLAERVDSLLDLAGLKETTARIGAYSRGMKQRLGIAQALVNSPRLLLLDEPTSALDPLGRKDVLNMIAALAGRTTVFFSTHILADVERVCDQAAILNRGRLVSQAPIEDLKARHGSARRLMVEVDDPERLLAALAEQPWVVAVQRRQTGPLHIEVREIETAQRELPGIVATEHLALLRFQVEETSLEDVFVDLVGREPAGRDAAGRGSAAGRGLSGKEPS